MTPLEPDVLVRLRLDFDGAVESFRTAGDSLDALADALADLHRRHPWRSPARFVRRHGERSWEPTRAERRAERRRVALDLRREARVARHEALWRRSVAAAVLGDSVGRGGGGWR